MESFQNALLISTPLTESAWAVLKPRLLAQRDVAERDEADRMAQKSSLYAKYEQRRHLDAQLKEEKEILDREWEEAQAPIRDQLAQFSDEIVHDKWDGGQAITYDTSPKFAVDVLIYVRQRFYAQVVEEDAAARSARRDVVRDPPNGPPTRRLILENMKYVFDTQIKKYTEQYRKELFLCHVCENSKFYGFEGVVQHFAAKHTNALSLGSVVVHWKADWPEYPPFHPDPNAAKAAFYAVPPPPPPPGPMHGPMHAALAHARYPPSPAPLHQPASHGPSASFTHFSPSPYGSAAAQYGAPFHGPHPHGPFAPPALPPSNYPGLPGFSGPAPLPAFPHDHTIDYQPGPHQSGFHGGPPPAPPATYQAPPPPPSSRYPGGGYRAHTVAPPGYGLPHPSTPYPTPDPVRDFAQSYEPSATTGYGSPPTRVDPMHGSLPPPPPPPVVVGAPNVSAGPTPRGMYQDEMDYMANRAREVWFGTSGVKDLPASVRIYVVIHQVASALKDRFAREPSLTLFTDGLTSHPAMKPIRNTNGLACRACGRNPHGSTSYGSADRRLYSLLALLGHFQTVHLERDRTRTNAANTVVYHGGEPMPRLDWKLDMIELPPRAVISDLPNAVGMDDSKLRLIADVFPDALPWPLPVLGRASDSGPSFDPGSGSVVMESWRSKGRGHDEPRRPPGNLRSPQAYGSSPFRRPSEWDGPPDQDVRPSYGGEAGHDHGPNQRLHLPGRHHDGRPTEDITSRYNTPKRVRSPSDDGRYGQAKAIKSDPMASPSVAPGSDRRGPERITVLEGNVGRGGGGGPDGSRQARLGSEDGELNVPAPTVMMVQPDPEPAPTSPLEPMSAAEQFLNDFTPAAAAETDETVVDRNEQSGPANSQGVERIGEGNRAGGGETGQQTSTEIGPVAEVGGAHADQREMRLDPGPPPVSRVDQRPPLGSEDNQVHEARNHPHHLGPGHAMLPARPVDSFDPMAPTGTRYAGTVMQHHPGHTLETGRRPRSGFERYETIRQGHPRARSRTPPRPIHTVVEPIHYRSGPTSAEGRYDHPYRSRSPVTVVRQGYPTGTGRRYSTEAHGGRYRSYAEESRAYGSQYMIPTEYVPVRRVAARSPPAGTVFLETSGQEGGGYSHHYSTYENDYATRPVYDGREPVYRLDRQYYTNEDDRRPSGHHHHHHHHHQQQHHPHPHHPPPPLSRY